MSLVSTFSEMKNGNSLTIYFFRLSHKGGETAGKGIATRVAKLWEEIIMGINSRAFL